MADLNKKVKYDKATHLLINRIIKEKEEKKRKFELKDYDMDIEKILFSNIAGIQYEYDEINKPVIEFLIKYFNNDLCIEKKLFQGKEVNLRKGIMILGGNGTGKTKEFHYFRDYCKYRHNDLKLRILNTQQIVRRWCIFGDRSIEDLFNSIRPKIPENNGNIIYTETCFDDLGSERPLSNNFGNKVEVMAEILYQRYEDFINTGIRTHATSNLNVNELRELYGNRIYSRMSEMFNIIVLDGKDRRK
jgi:DNA replication protein DnaC